jgi:hypothetical protein
MVNVGTGTGKTRIVKRKYPIEEGLIAGTTKQEGREENLIPEEKSTILEKDRRGL